VAGAGPDGDGGVIEPVGGRNPGAERPRHPCGCPSPMTANEAANLLRR
jgi:hypothetical protein